MNKQYRAVAQFLSAVFLFAACVSDGEPLGEMQSAALIPNGFAANGLIEGRIAASQVAEMQIATRAANGQLVASIASENMLSTESGRGYFSYIASCAMPAGTSIKAVIQGAAYEFPGGLGLAPAWEQRALNMSERRWVSACLLARVNAYGISVGISLRGNMELAPTKLERETFPVVEGAFYGDVLTSDPQNMEMVACRGAGQAAGEWGGLVNRDCAEPGANGLTVCGLRYAGDCLDYTPRAPSARACARSVDGNYLDCHKASLTGPWPTPGYREVVTVFVSDE